MRAFAAGVELLRNHRIEEALSAFQIGLTNDTSDEDAGALLYNIAVCQERLGRSEPAPRAIEEALRRRPPLAADVTTDLDFDLLRTKEPLRSHLRDLHLVTRRSPLLTIGLSFLYGILLGLPWGHIFAELLSSSSLKNTGPIIAAGVCMSVPAFRRARTWKLVLLLPVLFVGNILCAIGVIYVVNWARGL